MSRTKHSVRAEQRPKTPADAVHVVAALAGKRVVTVDLDATLYDAWACCGYRGKGYGSDSACTHARADTIALIRDVCRYQDAVPVILSWRGGLVDISRTWLDEIGFEYEALFIPGSGDDISDLLPRPKGVAAQVEFKLGTVQAIEQVCGATVVASFDDNAQVIEALGKHGVWETYRVEHLVTIERHEWAAGYLGAPKPSRPTYRAADRAEAWMPLPFDDPDRDVPPPSLLETLSGEFGDESECSLCSESLAVLPGKGSLCGWCAENESVEDDEFDVGDTVTLTVDGREVAATVQAIDSFDEVVVKVDDTGELMFVAKYDLS